MVHVFKKSSGAQNKKKKNKQLHKFNWTSIEFLLNIHGRQLSEKKVKSYRKKIHNEIIVRQLKNYKYTYDLFATDKYLSII